MTRYAAATISRGKIESIISRFWLYVVLILLGIVFVGPFLWMLSSSFKAGENIYDSRILPVHPTFANYIGVVRFMNLFQYFGSTVFLTTTGIVADVVLASLCAYPLAKMEFPGKKIVNGILVATMILPTTASMIVNYLTLSHLSLLNNYLAVILPGAVAVFSIILLRQAYFAIPNELLDAARIDGAGDLRIWYAILVPQTMPTIATIVIFDFVSKWNNFLWPIIVLKPSQYPLASALKYLGGQLAYNFGYIAAGTIISIIPTLVVFVAFQRYFINSVAGAIKG
jgi:putative chitobiose transport system permease protein